MKSLVLGIVDQSPIRKGGSSDQALRETVELAQYAESFGYARYWVAEHHNTAGFAGTAPEILIGQIAAHTKRIAVGSGGVMLSHYSAFKVAEAFSILHSFYPDRIELGLGRAPGSDQDTARALAYPKPIMDINEFPQQVTDLIGFLSASLPEGHPFAHIKSKPGAAPSSIPGIWLLGSSDYSARLAAALGLPFSFADFFGTTAGHGPYIAELYRQLFTPSGYLDSPKLNVSLQVICADTEEKAAFVASSMDVSRINFIRGVREPLISPEEATAREFTPFEIQHLEEINRHRIQGTPEQVHEQIMRVAETYGTSDVNIVTNCHYFEDRKRSFELVAQKFDLSNN